MHPSDFLQPVPRVRTLEEHIRAALPARPETLASDFYKRLSQWITEFDESLDPDYEVGIRLVNFGQTIVFHLEHIGYWDPALISFSGRNEDGEPVELIQHISQISILLMKLKRTDPTKPKTKIGFASEVDSDSKTEQ